MAHIVVITSGLTGILNASFELVSQLQSLGHQVTYACPKEVGKKVQAQGIPYVQLNSINYDPAPALPIALSNKNKIQKTLYKWQHRQARQAQAVEALEMQAFEQQIKQLKADLYILDVELHEHIMTLVGAEQPTLLLSQWFSLWNRQGLPYLLTDTIPNEGFAGSRLGLWLAWQSLKARRWWIFYKKKLRSGATNRRSILKKYANQVGFSKAYIPENYWPGPFTYAQLPVISMTARELEFPHDERPNHTYIGPLVHANRIDTNTDASINQRLGTIFANTQKARQKLIYCSVSTYRKGDQAFLKKVVKAVEGQTDWVLILGLGGMLDAGFLSGLPDNVYAFGWIPQLKVLAHADLSINHGGIHTINECVHFEVPMLVYSGKRSDQNGCAARVHYHKVGIMADKDQDQPSNIRAKIKEVLNQPIYTNNIKALAQAIQQYQTEQVLEKAIAPFVKSSSKIASNE